MTGSGLLLEQLGSYFGASICAVDLNADGFSDVLVGAPMQSNIREEGRVFVYINSGSVSPRSPNWEPLGVVLGTYPGVLRLQILRLILLMKVKLLVWYWRSRNDIEYDDKWAADPLWHPRRRRWVILELLYSQLGGVHCNIWRFFPFSLWHKSNLKAWCLHPSKCGFLIVVIVLI